MDTLTVVQGDTHPLLLLLSDLKSSLINSQNEAHATAVKLQHHSLSTSRALDRTHALEHQNSVLNDELYTLRSNPHPNFSSSKDQGEGGQDSVNQLTLSLRTLNEKLTATETILARRTAELTQTLGELQKSKLATDGAHELSARIRGREEALKSRERELELKVRLADERARMSERAVEDYANLVRTLEGRAGIAQSNGHAVQSTSEEDVQRLLREFAHERDSLHIQLSSTQHDLALLTSQLAALTKSSETTLPELANLRTKLQLLERDDTTATKMVSRYMKFSQTQTNHLQQSLSTLSTRHSATLSSLTSQIQTLTHTLKLTQSHNARLLSALDDLGNEVMKEGYGRRREVRLRIKLVGREERVLEGLRRWLRRAEEGYARIGSAEGGTEGIVLADMIQDAKILIDNLDSPLPIPTSPQSGIDTGIPPTPVSGSLARLITIQSTIDDLVEELQQEQAKRIALERLVVRQEVEDVTADVLPEKAQQNGFHEEKLSFPEPSTQPNLPSTLPLNEPALSGDVSSSPAPPYEAMMEAPIPRLEPSPASNTTDEIPIPPVPLPQSDSRTPTIEITPAPIVEPSPSVQAVIPGDPPPQQEQSAAHEESGSVVAVDELLGTQDENVNTAGRVRDDVNGAEDSSPVVGRVPGAVSTTVDGTAGFDGLLAEVDTASGDVTPEDRERVYASVRSQSAGAQAVEIDAADEEGVQVAQAEVVAQDAEEPVVDGKDTTAPNPADTGSITPALKSEDTNPTTDTSLPALAQPQPRSRPPTIPTLSMSPPSSPSSSPPPSSSHQPIPPPSQLPAPITRPPPHPLLEQLTKARNRYDHVQRAFHACHIALEGLKASLASTTSITSSHAYPGYPDSGHYPPSLSPVISNDVLSTIVQRLDDYTEDARVELEIRISDEEVMGRGYEALLMLPGAFSSTISTPPDEVGGDNTHVGSLADVEAQIMAFIDGTDPAISRAMGSFERKLGDIEYDVVVVKKAIHDPQSFFSAPVTTTETTLISDPTQDSASTNGAGTSGGGWTSWIRTPISRPTTPTLAAPTPTFGSVMTSRNKSPSTLRPSDTDIVRALGLKVPMPDFTFASTLFSGSLFTNQQPHSTSQEDHESPSSASLSLGGLGLGHAFGTGPRARTISTSMYMLGMGMGSPGAGAVNRSPMGSPLQRRVVSAVAPAMVASGRGSTLKSASGADDREGGEEEEEDVD
ncbi:hypothetical protein D9756_010176 [Leucocoprinus leucothites]|uniref:Uncharacterized protein n=1 Tax=Leucocoprinus leucothites TaxID=201217 RepID=A0A8H5CV66_9AGAR|nr:hypothetical protein D9756_010176 [Leucoagaricus leucothites]